MMKAQRVMFGLMFSVFALAGGAAVVTAQGDPLPPPEATGHLNWDPIDQVYRCNGTPLNCDF